MEGIAARLVHFQKIRCRKGKPSWMACWSVGLGSARVFSFQHVIAIIIMNDENFSFPNFDRHFPDSADKASNGTLHHNLVPKNTAGHI